MNGPFAGLSALEAHFRALGFVDQNGVADQSTAEFYSRVLVPGDDLARLLSVHIMSGEAIGQLEAGLTAYFDPPERGRVNAELAALAAALVGEAGAAEVAGRFLATALEGGRDDEREVGGVRFLVVFPEREPDQTFEVVHVEASRPLEPDEWLDAGQNAPGESAPGEEAVAACRAILRDCGHPLAERPLTVMMSTDMGGERVDVLTSDEGASLWLTTRQGKQPRLSIIAADGTRDEV